MRQKCGRCRCANRQHHRHRLRDHSACFNGKNYRRLTAANIDYVHGNAIEVDFDGNLLISSRHMDEITKIDRQTGALIWRWGGKHNQFTFLDDSVAFSHQHAIRRLPDGHYTLFDNGNYHDPQFSRASEYELDQVNLTARLVWEHRRTPDEYGFAMGYAERHEDGSTLVGYGFGKPDAVEVNARGEEVMTVTRRPLNGFANR